MTGLFGTDGIRGEVGKYPLTQDAVFALGRAVGIWLKEQYPKTKSKLRIAIGKDTRKSGDGLEKVLAKAAALENAEVLSIGICPTPVVAYLTKALGAHLGLAISASHNPGSDNGIKFFDARGYKLFSSAEKRLEKIFFTFFSERPFPKAKASKRVKLNCLHLYSDFAKNLLENLDLSPLKIVIDCAFGAFSQLGPKILRDLGAQVVAMHNQPDGANINVNCGTLHPQAMVKKILQRQADMGIALDGDGDRLIVADEKGNILDGDHIIAVLAQQLLKRGTLRQKTIVCTQMSNIGLELYLKRRGVRMIRTEVGDKYVLRQMLKTKAALGGEQSGHIIFLERTTTGDGLIIALELIKAMLKEAKPLSELCKGLPRFPQVLINVRVKEKRPLEQIAGLNRAIARSRLELGESGRLLVRYSGTENLARVMVEAPENAVVQRIANSVAKLIQKAVGENS